MVLSVLLALSYLFLGVQLVTLTGNLWLFPVLKRTALHPDRARVSLLVPARDEAHNLPETLPRLLAQGAAEVIVLDDDSGDGTLAFLLAAQADQPRLRVVRGKSLPADWSGKNWACQQLADQAKGDLLVFTDADVRWEPGTLDAVLTLRERSGAEFVSVWPRQLTETLSERLAVPVIDLILLGALPYWAVWGLPFPSLAAGNGQLMCFSRAAYGRVGGHDAFKAEVLEDVRMAQAVKRAHMPLALALGGELLAARMYRSAGEVLEGFGKNILAACGGSRALLIGLSLINALVYTAAWPLALVDPRWLGVGLLGLMQRALTGLKTRRSPLEAPLQPFMTLMLWPVAWRALARRGGYRWKGRDYAG